MIFVFSSKKSWCYLKQKRLSMNVWCLFVRNWFWGLPQYAETSKKNCVRVPLYWIIDYNEKIYIMETKRKKERKKKYFICSNHTKHYNEPLWKMHVIYVLLMFLVSSTYIIYWAEFRNLTFTICKESLKAAYNSIIFSTLIDQNLFII